MGAKGAPSIREDHLNNDRIEQPLLHKSGSSNGRDSHTQHGAVVSVPSSQDGSAVFGYNMGLRPYQDITFSIIFLLLVLVTFGFGIYGTTNSNPDYQWVESAHYDRRHGCSILDHVETENLPLHMGRILNGNESSFSGGALGSIKSNSDKPILITALTTLILSAPLALGMLWVLRTYTKELVYASLPFFVLLPIALNITWFVLCQRDRECRQNFDPSAQIFLFIFILLMCGLMIYVIYSNWERVELTIRVVKTASEALNQNLALVFILPSLTLVLFLFCIPVVTFMFYAYTNGTVIPNPDIIDPPEYHCGRGTDHPCCVWKTAPWVPTYLTLSGFAVLWSAMIMAQVQVFTISGTIAQWYFAQAESSTVGTTKRSLRNAFGPSFGTVCFSGLIVVFVRLIRSALNKADDERGQQGAVALLLRACLEWILQAVEFLTKYTSNFAAVTGESFCSSAVMTYNLLKRNFLSTMVVEVISDRLLAMVVVVCSVLYALLVYGILSLTTSSERDVKLTATLSSWLLLFLVLVLFVRVLSNVVDTMYICFAMDKDSGIVSKAEVHDVLVLLPASQDEPATLAVPREP